MATGTATGDRVEAAAFNGESYRTRDGRSAITLISRDALEYRLADGTTLLCKYSEQGNALRVIMTSLNTQQVLYFRRVPNGLQSNDGELYLNAPGLAELQRSDICKVARALSGFYVSHESFYLAVTVFNRDSAGEGTSRWVALDDATDGPRTADLVKRAVTGIYIQAGDFPISDPYGNQYQYVIGQKGNELSIISLGKDHNAGGGDDVVFRMTGASDPVRGQHARGAFVSTKGAKSSTCGFIELE